MRIYRCCFSQIPYAKTVQDFEGVLPWNNNAILPAVRDSETGRAL